MCGTLPYRSLVLPRPRLSTDPNLSPLPSQKADDHVVESSASQSIWITLFEATKYTYSLGLLVFSVVVIMAAICQEQTAGFEVR